MDCGTLWAKWCRGCNLVFCGAHIAFEAHSCPRRDVVHQEPVQPIQAVAPSPLNGDGSNGTSSQGVEGTG